MGWHLQTSLFVSAEKDVLIGSSGNRNLNLCVSADADKDTAGEAEEWILLTEDKSKALMEEQEDLTGGKRGVSLFRAGSDPFTVLCPRLLCWSHIQIFSIRGLQLKPLLPLIAVCPPSGFGAAEWRSQELFKLQHEGAPPVVSVGAGRHFYSSLWRLVTHQNLSVMMVKVMILRMTDKHRVLILNCIKLLSL